MSDVAKCDRCGKTARRADGEGSTPPDWHWVEVDFASDPADDFDLCDECTDAFREWIRNDPHKQA